MRSRRRPRARTLGPSLAAVLACSVLGVTPAAAAETAAPGPSAPVTATPAEPLLDQALRGRKAINRLGEQLAVAAARNDLRPAGLRTLLSSDPSVWVDPQGAIFYVDAGLHETAESTEADASDAEPPVSRVAPLSETFALHSNPTSNRTILLDFDGAYVDGTAWNDLGVTPATHAAWDPAGNGPSFTDSELRLVQQVWAIVAEDYAAFDVDVTTEDLGVERIERSSSSDAVYGTRVLVTPSDDPYLKICQRQCGGVAYLDVFDAVGSFYQPAWVFPQALGNSAKDVAEAASHEAGHNLGLDHDGTPSNAYYTGHGVWAPIMGVGYGRPLVQWSRGSYLNANNGQNDLAILTGYLGARPDEAADSVATPATLPVGEAIIGTASDVDAYVLGACAVGAVVSVQPSAVAPNLDVRATLVDAAGVERVVSAPTSGFGDGTTATGLGATLTVPSGDGWVLTVEGVGEGTWAANGYDDYASLGAYTVSAPGCDGALAPGVPGEPGSVTGNPSGTDSLVLSWVAPTTDGDGPVTGYVVSRSGSATTEQLGPDARSHTFTGLSAGTSYELSVRAVNATGAGRTITVSARTADPQPVAPSSPRNLVGEYVPTTGEIQAFWTVPESTGTAPISGYEIYFEGVSLGQLPPDSGGVTLSSDNGFAPGEYAVGVAAVSSAGSSPTATVVVAVDLPERPVNDDVADALVLPGAVGTIDGDNTSATAETTDPAPPSSSSAAGGYSVWYSWTPAQDGAVELRTSGGSAERDPTLAAYTGQPGSLTQVAGADDTDGLHAAISFAAVAGTRYLIAVDGFSFAGGSGPFTLTWSQTTVQAPSEPSAPTEVTAQPGNASATVSWTAPSANGSPITSYTVTSSPGGVTKTVDGTDTTTSLTGLSNGTSYTFTVIATNAVGDSPPSSLSNAVTPTLPDTAGPVVSEFDFTPKNVDITSGPQDVTVSVRLTDDTAAQAPFMLIGSDTTDQTLGFGAMTRISGTAQDGTYERTVTIPTTAAPGTWTVTLYPVEDTLGNNGPGFQNHPTKLTITNTPPAGAPDAPATPTVNLDGRTATVTWNKPTANGSAIIGYTITGTNGAGSQTVTADTTETVFTGLTRGASYTFTVIATNAIGDSPASPASEPVTVAALAPDASATPTASLVGQTATITWVAPAANGSSITGYTVIGSNGAGTRTVSGNTTQAVFTGLIRGQSYSFTLIATNAIGDSPASPASNPVTVAALAPDAPARPDVALDGRTATITWNPPAANGSPITGYTITGTNDAGTETVDADTNEAAITGLTRGLTYVFTVTATNGIGTSLASTASIPLSVPFLAPESPTSVVAIPGDGSARVLWQAPASDQPVTSYTVTASPGGRSVTVTTAAGPVATVTGLANGTAYTFTVVASSAAGTSGPSQVSNAVIPAGKPGQVARPTLKVKGAKIIVTWRPPATNGAPITRYAVKANKTQKILSGNARRTVLKNLKPGRYRVTVVAVNAAGTSAPSGAAQVRIKR